MGIQQRRQRQKENLRQAILEAAEELYVTEGFDHVSMRRIAEKIEYSPTTIYLYFKDKAELLSAILEGYNARLYEKLLQVMDMDHPVSSLKKGMRVYIDFGLDNPGFYRLAFLHTQGFRTEDYLAENSYGAKSYMNLRLHVEACIRDGSFRYMDVDLATQVIWSMNHGMASILITNPNFPWVDKDALISASIEQAVAGFLR